MVHFVGAGPGDKELITIKGKRLLEKADVIIYAGSLVNPKILEYAAPNCQIYNSAKMTLEDIEKIIVSSDKSGKSIVRLQTGDMSLYSAINEQIDMLKANNIKYDICPGVSSFCAAAAALETEYTLPDVTQSVIITRLAGKTPVPSDEDITLLAAHNAAMVVFLSAAMLTELSSKLISGGYSASTPAAIVYKATWDDEIIIRTTVSGLESSAAKYGISKTALIVVGNFLNNKYERSILYGRNKQKG